MREQMSTISWGSLYLPCADQEHIAQALRAALRDQGYELYDPFGLMPGKSYPQQARLFVAPPVDNWVRVLCLPDTALCAAVSRGCLCLALELDGDTAMIDTYHDGQQADPAEALLPYLRAGHSADHLAHILDGGSVPVPADPAPGSAVFDHLPQDVQALAGDVDADRAQQMFDRLSSGLRRKMGQRTATDPDAMAEAARGLIGGSRPGWNSAGGGRIRALMACLTVPANWREPDFITLRDAYQLHKRRERSPQARLYPGDAEAMARVPDALAYIPIYGGRSA
jgi:hypothetical protein